MCANKCTVQLIRSLVRVCKCVQGTTDETRSLWLELANVCKVQLMRIEVSGLCADVCKVQLIRMEVPG